MLGTIATASAIEWQAIRLADCPILVEPRTSAGLATLAKRLARSAPFERRGQGPVAEAVQALGEIPAELREDIRDLATRFAALMGVPALRIRLEGINTNACRKVHADYTDVRLITTYWGPGTEYVPAGQEPSDAGLVRLPAGHVALFKGRLFGEGHAPCFHRSPPVGDTGERRLVLVIDTPLDQSHMGQVPLSASC
jgi:hypothetical protein